MLEQVIEILVQGALSTFVELGLQPIQAVHQVLVVGLDVLLPAAAAVVPPESRVLLHRSSVLSYLIIYYPIMSQNVGVFHPLFRGWSGSLWPFAEQVGRRSGCQPGGRIQTTRVLTWGLRCAHRETYCPSPRR